MQLDQRAFRDALGHFATGVAVVTAGADAGEPVAMTVSSFNSVSLDPPLVLFSVMRTSASLPVLLASDHFGVSVLRGDQRDVSGRFAGPKGRKWDGFSPVSGSTGCPLIGESLATFECQVHATHDGGDHVIVVGRVLAFEMTPDADPLIFFRGAYRNLADAHA